MLSFFLSSHQDRQEMEQAQDGEPPNILDLDS